MLTSIFEHKIVLHNRAADILQPDAPRVGGITPFLKIASMADEQGVELAPHFVMEIHIHLAACFPRQSWVEHFEWLEPLFHERLAIKNGRILVPRQIGLGLTLSDEMRKATQHTAKFDIS